jgi:Trypsin-like peptidase domain
MVSVESESLEGVAYPYLLTAHHVIAKQENVEAQPPNPFAEGELYPPVAIEGWCQPLDGVDLALTPFEEGQHHSYKVRGTPLEGGTIGKELQLGSSIFYIGLLAPDDRPMARSGTIGALDQEKLKFKQGYSYPAHLVDCRSYGGFSGSPCFAETPFACLTPLPPGQGPHKKIPELTGPVGRMAHVLLLCGMFTSHRTDEGDEDNREDAASRYGVGVMLRSQEIREGLMVDKLKDQRRERDAEIAAARAAVAEKAAFEGASAGATEPGEFDRFEDLTGKLLKVPKKELDEKREEERRGE